MKTSLQDGMLRHYQEEAKMSDVNVERQIKREIFRLEQILVKGTTVVKVGWDCSTSASRRQPQNETYRKAMKDAGRGRLLP